MKRIRPGYWLLVLLLLAVAVVGFHHYRRLHPSATPAANVSSLPTGQSAYSLAVGGTTRTYRVYRPAGTAANVPLVIMLHGGFGSGEQAESSYGWDAEADKGHFIVAYPDGLFRAWNAGGNCCGKAVTNNVDDTGFIMQLVGTLRRQAPIDPKRIYATGISNGGIMSYRLACATSLFAAIGPDSATMLDSCTHPSPTSVIHIHGTADTHIKYYGGDATTGNQHIDGPAIPDLNARWRSIDNCNPPVITTNGSVTTSVADCPFGRSVELITIAGAGHQWPGGAEKSEVQQLLHSDPPSTALNATDTIWQFFAAHPLP